MTAQSGERRGTARILSLAMVLTLAASRFTGRIPKVTIEVK